MMEDWQKDMFDNIPGGVGVFQCSNEKLEVLALNRKLREILGVDEGDIGVKPREELLQIHPEEREWVYQRFQDSIRNGDDFLEITARFRNRKTKEYIWMRVDYSAIYETNGSLFCYATYRDITSEKKLEQQLQTNLYSMRTALDHCGIYYGLYNLKENMTIFNHKMRQDFGMPEMLFSGNTKNRGLLTEQGRASLMHISEEMRAGRMDSATVEIEVRRPAKGDWIWTKQFYTVMEKDENGLPLVVVSTAQDISKEKEDEKRFSEENMYHQMLYNNMTSIIRINITDWRVLDFAGEYVLKHTETESPFQTMANCIEDAGERKQFERLFKRENLMKQFSKGERKVSYTYRSRRISGKVLWMKTVVDMMERENGDVFGLISVQDVDRQILGGLVQSRVVNSLVDFVAYLNMDAEDSQVYAENSEYQVDESYAGADVMRQLQNQLEEMIVPEEREYAGGQFQWSNVYKKLKQGKRWNFVYHALDGEKRVRTKRISALFLREDWNVVMVLQRDITDITEEQEAQNAELQSALAIANRASHARDEFLSSMSHDLRTPLNGIIGAVELARNFGGNLPEQVEEYLKDIDSSGRFMLSLVNDLLDANRMEQGKLTLNLEKTSIVDVLKNVCLMFETTCTERGIHLVLEQGEYARVVYADPVRLQRIYGNLLSNAIKFTSSGGTIILRVVEREVIGDRYLVTTVVKDDGAGMSEEFQKRMYEIFTQEENEVNTSNIGTGLGLSIVKNLVELMGGNIVCKSRLGEGTEFEVTLPFQLAEEMVAKRPKQEKKEENWKEELLWDRRVLLVEDHDLNAKIVIRLLESKQIQVDWVVNGKEAVDKFSQKEPYTYDAILMDIQMPVMDGIQASKEIRKIERTDARLIPIIALTANAFDVDMQRSKSAGMNAHLVKPIEPKKLIGTLMEFWRVSE